MSFVSNIARERTRYFYDAVDSNFVLSSAGVYTSTTNAGLVVVPIETAGKEADGVLADYDTLAALLAGTNNEQTTMGRKVLTDTSLSASAQDDTNDRLDLDLPDLTWTLATGNAISMLLVCFDPDTTAGTDTDIIPLTGHDFVKTPDASDIVAQFSSTGFLRNQ